MNKRVKLLFVFVLLFGLCTNPIRAYAANDWNAENGTYGSVTKVDDNITLLKGADVLDQYGRYIGPYTKQNMKFFSTNNGLINFDVNVKIDPNSMATGERFTVSAALNDSKNDVYVSELRIQFTKLANGNVKVAPEVPWVKNTFTYEIKNAGIYSLRWEYTKGTQTVMGKFILKQNEKVLLSALNEDMDTILGSIPAYDKADSGRYLWFCDISVANGIQIYDQLPDNIYKPPVIDSDTTLKKEEVKDAILASDAQAKVELTVNEGVQNVIIPKDLLGIAADAGKELMVEVKNASGTVAYAWYFNGSDINQDINLVVKQASVNDVAEIKEVAKDGLVLDFNHSGALPTGTKVMMNVNDVFKANEKVRVSYYNETSKRLEESKEYTVSNDGTILMDISHCSKYVVEKVASFTAPETRDASGIYGLSILLIFSGFVLFSLNKKAKK